MQDVWSGTDDAHRTSRASVAPAAPASAHGFQHHCVTADGRPALGWHPGFQAGRVAIAMPSSGGSAGGVDGYHLSPLIGAAAAAMIAMEPSHALAAPEFQLGRKGLAIEEEVEETEEGDAKET